MMLSLMFSFFPCHFVAQSGRKLNVMLLQAPHLSWKVEGSITHQFFNVFFITNVIWGMCSKNNFCTSSLVDNSGQNSCVNINMTEGQVLNLLKPVSELLLILNTPGVFHKVLCKYRVLFRYSSLVSFFPLCLGLRFCRIREWVCVHH